MKILRKKSIEVTKHEIHLELATGKAIINITTRNDQDQYICTNICLKMISNEGIKNYVSLKPEQWSANYVIEKAWATQDTDNFIEDVGLI